MTLIRTRSDCRECDNQNECRGKAETCPLLPPRRIRYVLAKSALLLTGQADTCPWDVSPALLVSAGRSGARLDRKQVWFKGRLSARFSTVWGRLESCSARRRASGQPSLVLPSSAMRRS